MMDPLIAAAIGGAAGKAVEIIVDAGRDIVSHFKDHRNEAEKHAQENFSDLAVEIKKGLQNIQASLEENAASRQRFEQTVSDPAFIMWVHSALLNGTKTSNKDKHILLARLIIDRLQSEAESGLALDREQACNIITNTTPTGLRILGLKSILDRLGEPDSPAPLRYHESINETLLEWVIGLLAPYKSLTYTNLEIQRLRSLACVTGRTGMLAPSLKDYVSNGNRPEFKMEDFMVTEVGAHISDLWERHGLISADLTSTGFLIGIYVSDVIRNTVTDLSVWQRAGQQ